LLQYETDKSHLDDREVLSTQAKKMRDAKFNARKVTREVLKQCNILREKGYDGWSIVNKTIYTTLNTN